MKTRFHSVRYCEVQLTPLPAILSWQMNVWAEYQYVQGHFPSVCYDIELFSAWRGLADGSETEICLVSYCGNGVFHSGVWRCSNYWVYSPVILQFNGRAFTKWLLGSKEVFQPYRTFLQRRCIYNCKRCDAFRRVFNCFSLFYIACGLTNKHVHSLFWKHCHYFERTSVS